MNKPEGPIRLIGVGKQLTEDLLLWQQLGRALAANSRVPTIILQEPGEQTERMLEAEGLDPVDVLSRGEPARILEIAVRQENRSAVMRLTEEGVPAVALVGTDRGQIRHADGAVAVRGDLMDLARTGAVPVLATIGRHPGGVIYLPPLAAVLEALVSTSPPTARVFPCLLAPNRSKSAQTYEKLGDAGAQLAASDASGLSIRVLEVSEVQNWPVMP